MYASMNGEERATIIKLIFKYKDLAGFSKLTSKATQLMFLCGQGDSVCVEAEVMPYALLPAVASPTAPTPDVPDTSEIDAQIASMLSQRRVIMTSGAAFPGLRSTRNGDI